MGSAKLDKVPPQSADAERAILGALMLPDESSETVPIAMQALVEDDFYTRGHQYIYEAIVSLFEKDTNVDLLTVTQALEQSGRLERAGGVPALDEMIESVPTVANLQHYVDIVKELSMKRQLIMASAKIYNQAFDDSLEFEQVIGDAGKAISDIEMGRTKEDSVVPMKAVVSRTIKRVQEIAENPDHLLGLPTGFKALDKKICGVQKGDLTIIAGRPGMGKSIAVQQIAESVGVEHGKPVLWFSLEMSIEMLGMRIMASATNIPLSRIRGGYMNDSDWTNIAKGLNELADSPVDIDDMPGLTIEEIKAKCRVAKQSEQGLELVIVDYFQLIGAKGKHEDERRKLNYIAEQLKQIARTLDIAVVLVSQLSRDCEKRPDNRPRLSDLRETGRLEEEADVVIFIYRDSEYSGDLSDKSAEFIVRKQRSGPTGTVKFEFDGAHTRFKNL